MPFILFRVSCSVSREQETELKTRLGKAVVRSTGIDEDAFLTRYQDGSAQESLDVDLQLGRRLGIRSLPAYLLEYGGKAVLLQTFDYEDFVAAIREITGGEVIPQSVSPSTESLRALLQDHPLISMIEIREALDLEGLDTVWELVDPLIAQGKAALRDVGRGIYIQKT